MPQLAPSLDADPADETFRQRALARFEEDGFVWLRGVLDASRVTALREEAERATAPSVFGPGPRAVCSLAHLWSAEFRALVDLEPVVDLAERLLPAERRLHVDLPQVLNVAALTLRPGAADQEWHVDGYLFTPRPAEVDWDDRVPFPAQILTAMYYLSEGEPERSPTEFLPGSHRSGSMPPEGADELRCGDRPSCWVVPSAGDCVLFHSQVWHRARANRSATTRFAAQVHYGKCFVGRTNLPFPNGHVPLAVLTRSSAQRKRLLGVRPLFTPFA